MSRASHEVRPFGPKSTLKTLLILAHSVLLLLAFSVGLARAGTQADTTDSEDFGIETQFKVYPSPIWGRTAGFAAGVGYEVQNLMIPESRLLATAKPGQFLGRYTLTYFAADPFKAPLYGLANVYYETTGHQWYYGLGPASARSAQMAVEKHMVEAEARLGFQLLNRRIFAQPVVKYLRHDVDGFEAYDKGATAKLSAESLSNLLSAAGMAPNSTDFYEGFGYGLSAGVDLRDNPIRTRKGLLVQGFANRYDFGGTPELAYDQYGLSAYAFAPVGLNTLALRVNTQLTSDQGGAVIPFFLLPSLHGRMLPGYSWDRFFGMDLFAVNVEYIVPLFDLYRWVAMDALLSLGAANVYDDISEQFEPAVSFDKRLEPGREKYPLRPSAAAGFQVESFTRFDLDIRVLVGWGTEGIRLVKFGFVQDLRDIELNSR